MDGVTVKARGLTAHNGLYSFNSYDSRTRIELSIFFGGITENEKVSIDGGIVIKCFIINLQGDKSDIWVSACNKTFEQFTEYLQLKLEMSRVSHDSHVTWILETQ